MLQRKIEHVPTIENVATPRQSKIICVLLYNANNEVPKIGENKSQNRNQPVNASTTVEQEIHSIKSIDFTTSIWKDELQEKIDETSYKLNETITANKLQMEQDFKTIFNMNSRIFKQLSC